MDIYQIMKNVMIPIRFIMDVMSFVRPVKIKRVLNAKLAIT